VDLTWGRVFHLVLDLVMGNGVDDQPTPIIKLPQACGCAPITLKFCNETSFELLQL
jgi:hypothetical protein